MARTSYEVDWGDQFFPKIVQRVGLDADPSGMTFAEAKREAVESVRNSIKHWKSILGNLRKLKASESTKFRD